MLKIVRVSPLKQTANGYLSTLQVTSYNFPKSENTAEHCAGVVEACPLHENNTAQHVADLEMLSTI